MSIVITCKLPKGLQGITLFPFIFISPKASARTLLHEKIHIRQQLEMLIIFFYIIYIFEFLFRRYLQMDKEAYRNISFEREARYGSIDKDYLSGREAYTWTKWL